LAKDEPEYTQLLGGAVSTSHKDDISIHARLEASLKWIRSMMLQINKITVKKRKPN